MDVSAIIKAILQPQGDQPAGPLPDLNPGDRLTGKIVGFQDNGRVLVDLEGARVSAQIGFPVQAGQNLQLLVVKNESVLHLRAIHPQDRTGAPLPMPQVDFSNVLASQDQDKLGQIVQRLTSESGAHALKIPLPENIQNALTQIQSVLEKLNIEQSPRQIARWLKNAVEDRGILFEKRMADLPIEQKQAADPIRGGNLELARPRIIINGDAKSQLILLQNYLAQTGEHNPLTDQLNPKEIDFLRSSVERMLGHIEQQQGRAVARWADGDMQQVFVHTLPLLGQNRPLQLKLYYPRKEGRAKHGQAHRIALLLDMERLGPVRVDLSMIEGYLKISFFVRDLKAQQLMTHHIHEVETSLAGHFERIQIEILVSEEKIRQFEEEDSKETAAGRINLKI